MALAKYHIEVETLGIHGYVSKNNELIIPAPFESEESMWVKSQNKFSLYKKYGIHKVTISRSHRPRWEYIYQTQ